MEKEQILNVSWAAIFKIFIAVLIFYFIYLTREIALWFLFALTISVLLDPAIVFFRRLWIPKIFAVLFVYFSIFGILGLLIYLIAPIFINELRQLVQHMPEYVAQISPLLQQAGFDTTQAVNNLAKPLSALLAQSSKSILSAITVFLGGLYSTLFILTTAFFLSLEDNAPKRFLTLLSPKKYEENIAVLFLRAQNKISGWFGARVLSCLFVGIASFVVFYIFGVKYALILAILSGFLNFIPYIGPWITAILLLVFVAVSSGSWVVTLYVIAAATLIQMAENNILTPILMKKLVDVPPVLVIISLLIGGQLFGFLGVIFAVPVFGIIFEFLKEFLERKRELVLESD